MIKTGVKMTAVVLLTALIACFVSPSGGYIAKAYTVDKNKDSNLKHEEKEIKEIKKSVKIRDTEYFLIMVPAPEINDPIGMPAPNINDPIEASPEAGK